MESNDNIKIILKEDDNIKFKLDNKIEKIYPPLENLEVNPSKEEQTFKSKDYYGYDEVKVNKVTNSIDENIKPENIKKDVSILGVTGNVEELNATEISVNPTSEEQVITPEEPYNGFSKVIVGAQSGITPTGTIDITENGTHDVTNYESANVQVGSDNMLQQKIDLEGNALYLFYNSTIKDFSFTSSLDLSKCTSVARMFQNCSFVVTVPEYDASNAGSNPKYQAGIQSVFYSCSKLENVGGFKNYGKGFSDSVNANEYNLKFDISGNKKLTHDSLINIINGLYDIASAGVQPQQLILGSTNLAKLTDEEKAIATNKGWNVS